MPFTVTCPNPACKNTVTAPSKAAGRRVRCPACRRAFVADPTADRQAAETYPAPPGAAPPPDRADPAAVGRFRVVGKVGAGAFGTVYRAYDPHLDREVALKVPKPGVLDTPDRVERFLREAKAAANLRHPN